MPTKPVTSPPIWASNANWTVGPHAGQPTKVAPSAGEAQNGQVGGQTYKGQWSNYLINNLATWVATWLALGSSAGAADAHVVETDANGATSARQLTAIGLGSGDNYGVGGQGIGSGPGVLGIGGNGAAGGSGDAFTGGFGVRGLSGTAADLAGVLGIGRSGADHYGVLGIGAGAHPGVFGQGGSTTAPGVVGNGGSVSGVGVLGTGNGSGAGVRGEGALGVWGISDDTTSNYGVAGHSAAGADATSAGVRGSGFGDATGVWGVAVDGYGMIAQSDTTSPNRAALRLVPQDSEPSTATEGDLYFDNESVGSGPLDHDELRVRSRGAWRSVMLERLGYTRAYARVAGPATATTTLVPVTVVSPSLVAPTEPRRTGSIYILVTGEIGRTVSGTTQSAILRLLDLTDSVTISTRTIELFQDGANGSYERDVAWLVQYSLPDVGPRNFRLELETSNGSDGSVRIRNTGVQIYGVV